MATFLDTEGHFRLTLWDTWGPVMWVGGSTQMRPLEPPPPPLLAGSQGGSGRRLQGSEFVGGWIGARGVSSQIEWEGDNLFF